MRYTFLFLLLFSGCASRPVSTPVPAALTPLKTLKALTLSVPQSVSVSGMSVARPAPLIPPYEVIGWDFDYSWPVLYYTLYYGTNSGTYTKNLTTTNKWAALQALTYGARYYLYVTATGTNGVSNPSPEFTFRSGSVTCTVTAISDIGTEFSWSTNLLSRNDFAQRYFRLTAVSSKVVLQASTTLPGNWTTIFTSTNVWNTNRVYTLQLSRALGN